MLWCQIQYAYDFSYLSSLLLLLAQVWMPDEPKTTSSSARSQSMRWDDRPSSASAVLSPTDAEPASASGHHTPTDHKGTQQKGPPSWWDPPPRIHVDQRHKEQVWLFVVTATMPAPCMCALSCRPVRPCRCMCILSHSTNHSHVCDIVCA